VGANTRNRKDVFAGWGFDVVKTIVAENLDAMPETWTPTVSWSVRKRRASEFGLSKIWSSDTIYTK
jgi:hypothetical protein